MTLSRRHWLTYAAALAAGRAYALQFASGNAPTPFYTAKVVRSYVHDRQAFTQGLQLVQGTLYEGTGLVGQSSLRQVALATGRVLRQVLLPAPFFGEGITVLNGKVYQLTWQHETGFVYDQATFRVLRKFPYQGEGWGLTTDGKQLYMSDGTPAIRLLDPVTLRETSRVTVRYDGRPLQNLNELEWVKGELWANIWQTDWIARVRPSDGKVIGMIDCRNLLTATDRTGQEDVLNGIAWDAKQDKIYVTGKLWPKLFEIHVTPRV